MKNQKNLKDAGEEGKNRVPFIAAAILAFFAGALVFSSPSYAQKEESVVAKEVAQTDSAEKQRNETETDNQTEAEQKEIYSYDASVLPDPFLPLVQETTARVRDIATVEITTPASPLQRYDLDDFNLVAVIISEEPAALLEDPEGFGYTVRQGMEIGKQNGVITNISRQGITVEEKYQDPAGNIELRVSNLTIRSSKK